MESEKKPPSSKLLKEVNDYMNWIGMYDPYQKVYIQAKCTLYTAPFLVILVASHLLRWNHVKDISNLTGRKIYDPFDGCSFTVGLITILKQFKTDVIELFFEQITNYAITLSATSNNTKLESNSDVTILVQLINEFIHTAGLYSGLRENFTPHSL